MKKYHFYRGLFISLLFFFAHCTKRPVQILATQGRLDLQEWDFTIQGPAKLNGEWTFFWNKLLQPDALAKTSRASANYTKIPSAWNKIETEGKALGGIGFATYALEVQLPQQAKELALKIPYFSSAAKIFINGKSFLEMGTVGQTEAKSNPAFLPQVLLLDNPGKNLQIVIHVSNFHTRFGGFRYDMYLGRLNDLQSMREKNLMEDFLVFGALLLMALYHFGLFALRRKDRSTLFFGILCLMFSIRPFLFGEIVWYKIFPNFPWLAGLRMEYLTFYLAVPVLAMYVFELFRKETPIWFLRTLLIVTIPLSGAVLILPAYEFTQTLVWMQALASVAFFIGIYVLLKAFVRNKRGAFVFFLGMSVFAFTVIQDFLHNNGIIHTGFFSNYGLLAYIFSQSYFLSSRFSYAYDEYERLSVELEAEVEERTRELSAEKIKSDDARKEAETANRAKSLFMAMMSHEFRTPLNAIIGGGNLLSTTNLDADQLAYSDIIHKSGQSLLSLVNDLLDYSRLDSGNLRLRSTQVNLSKCVLSVLDIVKSASIARQVLVLCKPFSEDFPKFVLTDEERLSQILINLLNNAIKFTDKGRIQLECKVLNIRENQANIEFSITDTGVGISKEHQALIFEPYVQADATNTHRLGGVGLGLAISTHLVRLLGGKLQVESELGKGSRFYFSLPMTVVSEDANRENSDTSTLSKDLAARYPLNILIAEDNPINQMVLEAMLEKMGYTPTIVANGQEALLTLEREPVDLILMDIQMPVLDGKEATRRIRKKYPNQKIKIVAITANVFQEDRDDCRSAGMDDFIEKPFPPEALRRVIEAAYLGD